MRSTNEALGNAVEYGNLYDNYFLLELRRRAAPGEEKRGSQPLPPLKLRLKRPKGRRARAAAA